MFRLIAEADRLELWRDSGARDMAHWLWMRYGISEWKARRWIASAHALEGLPRVSQALSLGELSIDKVVELTRFATPETEARLLRWARGVSPGAIRHRGDLAIRREACEAKDPEETRFVSWSYFDEGRRFGLEGELPAAQGAVVARALHRLAGEIPVMPEEDRAWSAPARRADALVALCSARIASDPDPDRATVVIHASVEALAGEGNARTEDGGIFSTRTAQRLACNHRLVHEYGWRLHRDRGGTVRWFHPDGTRYRAGPRPRAGPKGVAAPESLAETEAQPILSMVGP